MPKRKAVNYKTARLLADNRESSIIKEGREILAKNGFSEDDAEYFADRMDAAAG